MPELHDLLEKEAIEYTLIAYARACDERNWPAFDAIFAADVAVDYGGEFVLDGREQVVGMIRNMLGGCGPTQHLLGNVTIDMQGEQASSRCYVRAIHAGLGDAADSCYEVWAEYLDDLVKTADGWRIVRRHMAVHRETGSRAVLKPA